MTFQEQMSDITYDLWEYLRYVQKPIVLYGTGDGADKICNVLAEKGILVTSIFASDNFARNNLFRDYTVTDYESVVDRLESRGGMVILLGFGTNLPAVMHNIRSIDRNHEFYAPDVPVYGKGLMTRHYFRDNIDRYAAIYDRLCDEQSKHAFVSCLKYRLTGKISYLTDCESTVEESYERILQPYGHCRYIDVGAYNGDTIDEFCRFAGNSVYIDAFEPDKRNCRMLKYYAAEHPERKIIIHNAAAWNETKEITFYARSGRGSGTSTSHPGAKEIPIHGMRVDDVAEHADYVKIDAEGADKEALLGMEKLFHSRRPPTLCVAAYHRHEDYLDIPETVLSMYDSYNLYFRHFPYFPCWDTNFYFVPRFKR